MRRGIGIGIAAAVLLVMGAGCATEEWTETLFAKREVEVDQRFVKVETEVRKHDERIHRVDGRVNQVEVRVNQLDTRLTETRELVRTSIPQAPSGIAGRGAGSPRQPGSSTADTSRGLRMLVGIIVVPFGFDRADIDADAVDALAAIVKRLHDDPNLMIDLEGTTDPVGRRDYNVRLSQRRVETVKRWLVDRGVQGARIVGSTGRGPITDGSVQDNVKRRVVVKVLAPRE